MKNWHFWLFWIISCFSLCVATVGAQSNQAQPIIPDYPIHSIAMSGDGTRLAVLGRTGEKADHEKTHLIDIVDASTLQILSSIEITNGQPNMLGISPDGRWLVYNIAYTELTAIDTFTGQSILLFPGGVVEVNAFDWSPTDGKLAFAVGSGLNIVDVYTGHSGASLRDHDSPGLISAIAWDKPGESLVTATYFSLPDNPLTGSGNIQIWTEAQITSEATVNSASKRFSGGGGGKLEWSPSGEFIANSQKGSIALFDTISGQQTNLL